MSSSTDPPPSGPLIDELKASPLPNRICTLIFVRTETDVLLGMKKRGFGDGKLNGFGGKLEETDLDIQHSAARELQEESSLSVDPQHFEKFGVIYFRFDPQTTKKKVDGKLLVVHIFVVDWKHCQGQEALESEEMRPEWHSVSNLPLHAMWIDDRYWLQRVMDGEKIEAAFDFVGFDKITKFEIRPWTAA